MKSIRGLTTICLTVLFITTVIAAIEVQAGPITCSNNSTCSIAGCAGSCVSGFCTDCPCTSDSDCPSGQLCHLMERRCRSVTYCDINCNVDTCGHECDSNDDCDDGDPGTYNGCYPAYQGSGNRCTCHFWTVTPPSSPSTSTGGPPSPTFTAPPSTRP